MVFHSKFYQFITIVLLMVSFCTPKACLAQGSKDNNQFSTKEKITQNAIIQWIQDTEIEISDELKKKQEDSAFMLTISTKAIAFFALLRDHQEGEITLVSFGTAFAIMTAITYYSTKYLQRYDRFFSKPLPWGKFIPKFLKRSRESKGDDKLLNFKEMNPQLASTSFVENLLRRAGFSAVSISILNAILHSKNELVNNSHAIWTQEGLFETASLVLAASFGSSMFHAIRNTFVTDPAKSERVYSYTSVLALNLMGLYQLGFHAAIPAGLFGLPFELHTTLVATYLTYAVGSIVSIFMRDSQTPKGPKESNKKTDATSQAPIKKKTISPSPKFLSLKQCFQAFK